MNVDELWFRFRMPLPRQKTDSFNIKMAHVQFQNKIASKKVKNKTSNGRRWKKKKKNVVKMFVWGHFLRFDWNINIHLTFNMFGTWDNIRLTIHKNKYFDYGRRKTFIKLVFGLCWQRSSCGNCEIRQNARIKYSSLPLPVCHLL